jgi:hypothetical protein
MRRSIASDEPAEEGARPRLDQEDVSFVFPLTRERPGGSGGRVPRSQNGFAKKLKRSLPAANLPWIIRPVLASGWIGKTREIDHVFKI